ncbi:MAG: PilN domain-containing protein [Deltaproteobacteria bacterium]|nr:PilN domain-containing protein [Deltaproteobacteria bacterium]
MIKGINLIPDEIKDGWRLKRWKRTFILAAAAYLAVPGLVYFRQHTVITQKRAEEAALQKGKESFAGKGAIYTELSRRIRDAQQAETELKKRLNVTADLADKRISWSNVLKKLSHDVPQGLWLKNLSTSDSAGSKKLRILGSALSNRAVADFIFTLENSGYFDNVALSYTQRRDFGSETVYDFELSASLRKTDEVMYEW